MNPIKAELILSMYKLGIWALNCLAVTSLWVLLETVIYGTHDPRIVDTIMTWILSLSMYRNFMSKYPVSWGNKITPH